MGKVPFNLLKHLTILGRPGDPRAPGDPKHISGPTDPDMQEPGGTYKLPTQKPHGGRGVAGSGSKQTVMSLLRRAAQLFGGKHIPTWNDLLELSDEEVWDVASRAFGGENNVKQMLDDLPKVKMGEHLSVDSIPRDLVQRYYSGKIDVSKPEESPKGGSRTHKKSRARIRQERARLLEELERKEQAVQPKKAKVVQRLKDKVHSRLELKPESRVKGSEKPSKSKQQNEQRQEELPTEMLPHLERESEVQEQALPNFEELGSSARNSAREKLINWARKQSEWKVDNTFLNESETERKTWVENDIFATTGRIDRILDRIPDEAYKALPWMVKQIKKNPQLLEDPLHTGDIVGGAGKLMHELRNNNQRVPDINTLDFHGLQEWMYEHYRQISIANGGWKERSTAYTFDDGWTVDQLTNADDAAREGDILNHCVGSYGQAIEDGTTGIFSLRDASGIPFVTMEIIPRRDKQGSVTQVFGYGDTPPKAEYVPRIREFFDSLRDEGWTLEWAGDEFLPEFISNSSELEDFVSEMEDLQRAAEDENPNADFSISEIMQRVRNSGGHAAAYGFREETNTKSRPEVFWGDILSSFLDPSDTFDYDEFVTGGRMLVELGEVIDNNVISALRNTAESIAESEIDERMEEREAELRGRDYDEIEEDINNLVESRLQERFDNVDFTTGQAWNDGDIDENDYRDESDAELDYRMAWDDLLEQVTDEVIERHLEDFREEYGFEDTQVGERFYEISGALEEIERHQHPNDYIKDRALKLHERLLEIDEDYGVPPTGEGHATKQAKLKHAQEAVDNTLGLINSYNSLHGLSWHGNASKPREMVKKLKDELYKLQRDVYPILGYQRDLITGRNIRILDTPEYVTEVNRYLNDVLGGINYNDQINWYKNIRIGDTVTFNQPYNMSTLKGKILRYQPNKNYFAIEVPLPENTGEGKVYDHVHRSQLIPPKQSVTGSLNIARAYTKPIWSEPKLTIRTAPSSWLLNQQRMLMFDSNGSPISLGDYVHARTVDNLGLRGIVSSLNPTPRSGGHTGMRVLLDNGTYYDVAFKDVDKWTKESYRQESLPLESRRVLRSVREVANELNLSISDFLKLARDSHVRSNRGLVSDEDIKRILDVTISPRIREGITSQDLDLVEPTPRPEIQESLDQETFEEVYRAGERTWRALLDISDPQKHLYYNSEDKLRSMLPPHKIDGGRAGIQTVLDTITSSNWFKTTYPDLPNIIVQVGYDDSKDPNVYLGAYLPGGDKIWITPNEDLHTVDVLLHELAHAVTVHNGALVEPHGEEFTRNHIYITKNVLGNEYGNRLEEALAENGLIPSDRAGSWGPVPDNRARLALLLPQLLEKYNERANINNQRITLIRQGRRDKARTLLERQSQLTRELNDLKLEVFKRSRYFDPNKPVPAEGEDADYDRALEVVDFLSESMGEINAANWASMSPTKLQGFIDDVKNQKLWSNKLGRGSQDLVDAMEELKRLKQEKDIDAGILFADEKRQYGKGNEPKPIDIVDGEISGDSCPIGTDKADSNWCNPSAREAKLHENLRKLGLPEELSTEEGEIRLLRNAKEALSSDRYEIDEDSVKLEADARNNEFLSFEVTQNIPDNYTELYDHKEDSPDSKYLKRKRIDGEHENFSEAIFALLSEVNQKVFYKERDGQLKELKKLTNNNIEMLTLFDEEGNRLLWRGMSWEALQSIKESGVIKTNTTRALKGQEGFLFTHPHAGAAKYYAEFQPGRSPSIDKPGYLVLIKDPGGSFESGDGSIYGGIKNKNGVVIGSVFGKSGSDKSEVGFLDPIDNSNIVGLIEVHPRLVSPRVKGAAYIAEKNESGYYSAPVTPISHGLLTTDTYIDLDLLPENLKSSKMLALHGLNTSTGVVYKPVPANKVFGSQQDDKTNTAYDALKRGYSTSTSFTSNLTDAEMDDIMELDEADDEFSLMDFIIPDEAVESIMGHPVVHFVYDNTGKAIGYRAGYLADLDRIDFDTEGLDETILGVEAGKGTSIFAGERVFILPKHRKTGAYDLLNAETGEFAHKRDAEVWSMGGGERIKAALDRRVKRIKEIAEQQQVELAEQKKETVPPPLNSTPIPPGHLRLYHQTSDENAENISIHGLDSKYSESESYGEPGGIWTTTKEPFYTNSSAAIIEVDILANDPRLDPLSFINLPKKDEELDQSKIDAWNNSKLSINIHGVISPEEMTIHRDWHKQYRYLKDHIKRNNDISILDQIRDEASYKKAVEYYEEHDLKDGKAKIRTDIQSLLEAINNSEVLGSIRSTLTREQWQIFVQLDPMMKAKVIEKLLNGISFDDIIRQEGI